MTPRRAALWCGAGLLAILGIAAMAVALALLRPDLIRPLVQRALAPRGGSASLAGLSLGLSPPSLSISGLAIAGPPREGDLLRLDRLRVEPALGRLLFGGPWLRRVEVGGLVLERPRPREARTQPDLSPLTRLFEIEELSLSDARVRLALAGGTVSADGLRLELTPGAGGIRTFRGSADFAFRRNGSALAKARLAARGSVTREPAIEVGVELAAARLELPFLSGDLSGRAAVGVTRKRLEVRALNLAMPRARLGSGPQAEMSPTPLRLDVSGSAALDFENPVVEVRALDAGDLLLARGRLAGPTTDRLSGTLDGEVPRVERVKALLAPLLPSRTRGMELRGALPFRIGLAARGPERVLTVEVRPQELAFSWPDGGVDCRFGGVVAASGPFAGWPREGTSLEWQLLAGAGKVSYRGRALPLGNVEIRGSAWTAGGSIGVKRFEVRSDTVGRLTGSVSVRNGMTTGSVNGSGLSAAALLPLAGALGGRDWSGWAPNGAIDVAARVEPADSGPRVTATAALAKVGFSSPAGDLMGQNISGRLVFEALFAPRPRVSASLAVSGGEALFGTVYVDFAKGPLDMHSAATRKGPDEYTGFRLDGSLAGFGRLAVSGEARRAAGRWRPRGQLALSELRLGPLFRTFVRDPLAASHPDLASLAADGTARLDLSFSASEKSNDLSGRFVLRSGDVRREGEPPIVSDLDIDLPIAYSLGIADPGRPRPSGAAAWGRLSVKRLRLGAQELGPLQLPIVLVPNRLYLGGDIDTSLLGAGLHLRKIHVDEPLSSAFRVELGARVDGLDLARLSGKKPTLEGRIGGDLDPVRVDRERLTTAGDLTGDLFGGRVDVRNVTVERPFGAGREIGGDVNVRLLDLERLSEALGVGRITGRISGSLTGLRVAYGQPVAFHLKMESVPQKGIPQMVSLKAVNSISLVSTGSALSGLGVSLMTTFFREFPYEKIAFECILKNDVFTVRGLIHKDGVEYLVKRGLFTGIDVINRNPDNRIGFSDMLERARRVTSERPQ